MPRSTLTLAILLLAGCIDDPAKTPTTTSTTGELSPSFTREHVTGDIYHYELIIPVGDEPNAALRVHRVVRERAPYEPRKQARAAMLLHGDFATFTTNFVPVLGEPASPVTGLAAYLASQDLDVWGIDRRWTLAAADGDTSDFGDMGVAQEIADIRAAMAFARQVRRRQGHGGPLALVGFSHGAQLAYVYAADEGARPIAQRHASALVPIDFYGELPPAETGLRQMFCEASALEYQQIAAGVIDSPNGFLIEVGRLARTAPDDPSPFFEGATNRGAIRFLVGQTYVFVPFAPFYHLASPVLDGEVVVGLRETADAAIDAWLEGASPHQALRELADLDALLCGEGALPIDAPLSRIEVPLFYLGAAGGIGTLGLHATTRVSSTDVTTHVVQRFAPERRAEDFGHVDLLLAADAPVLAWQPLASWLLHH